LDFLPNISAQELLCELKRRRKTELSAEDLLTGILHNRLGRVLTKAAGINGNRGISALSDEELFSRGTDARKFVLETRNNVIQAKKILDMLA
jgi:predicted flavoprotein YhiN